MDEFNTTHADDDGRKPSKTPEDVAALYTWASLREGTYRDFSAERREHRAQQRHRSVEARRQVDQEIARANAVLADVTAYGASLEDARYDDAGRDGEVPLPVRSLSAFAAPQLEAPQEHAQSKVEAGASTGDDLARALERTRLEVEAAQRGSGERATSYADLARRRHEIQSKAAAALSAALAAGAVEDLGEEEEQEFAEDSTASGEYASERTSERASSHDAYPASGPTEVRAFAPGSFTRSSGDRAAATPRIAAPESSAGDSFARRNTPQPGVSESGSRNIFSRGMEAGRPAEERAQWGRTPMPQATDAVRPSGERPPAKQDAPQSAAPAAPSFGAVLKDRLEHEDATTVHLSEPLPEATKPVEREVPREAPREAPRGAGYGSSDGSIFGLNAGMRAALTQRAETRAKESAQKLAQPEAPKAEAPRQEIPRQEAPRQEAPRQEAPRQAQVEERHDPLPQVKRESGVQPAVRPHPAFFGDDGTSGDVLPELRRRRDSAADRTARTERRPRMDESPVVSFEFRKNGTNGFGEPRAPEARPQAQDRTAHGNDGPEWLLRNQPAEAMPDDYREKRQTDSSEIEAASRQRLEEQQRLHAEARRATELRVAEEQRLAAARAGATVRESYGSRPSRPSGERFAGTGSFEREYDADPTAIRSSDLPPVSVPDRRVNATQGTAAPDAAAQQPVERRQTDERRIDEAHRRAIDEERARTEREHFVALRQRRMEQSLMGDAPRASDSADRRATDPPHQAAPQREQAPPPVQEQARPIERPSRDDARYARTVMEASSAPPQSERRRTPRVAQSEFFPSAAPLAPMTIVVANTAPRPQTVSMTDRNTSIADDADTLQSSRERMAARWYALHNRMNGGEMARVASQPEVAPTPQIAPSLSVVALWGGTGKTSMVATLGRVLSAGGEKVLLADATVHGLLPYYFGAQELRPDVVRTFTPPPGCVAAPVFMVNYDLEDLGADEVRKHAAVEAMMKHARGASRVLLDLNRGSAWLARVLTQFPSNVLVPIVPDMNSVIGLQRVERFFAGCMDAEGQPVQAHYVLNQFDASLPLHLDVREVLRQQLGDRLLPVTIRRSTAVPEALADGMTVIDYAPDSPVADDYMALADWVRALAPPVTAGLRSVRWSER